MAQPLVMVEGREEKNMWKSKAFSPPPALRTTCIQLVGAAPEPEPLVRRRSSTTGKSGRFSPGPRPKATEDASWCSIISTTIVDILNEYAPSELDAKRYRSNLRIKGYDNIWAFRDVINKKDINDNDGDELEVLGIDQLVPRRRMLKHLKQMSYPALPSTSLSLDRFLFSLLEYDHPEDNAFLYTLEKMEALGISQVSHLQHLNEDQMETLPMLDGHKLALLHVKENGAFDKL